MQENSKKNETTGFNWNWGKGLTLVITLFIVATLSVVGYIVSLDYHMVSENHYEEAVNYQQHINSLEHAESLEDPVEIKIIREKEVVQVRFPASISFKNLKGTIELYRPNDSSMDHSLDLMLDEKGIQNIESKNLSAGKWIIKVSWNSDSTSYYKQQSIFI